MTTIHSFTNDQNLLDVFHKDLLPRARRHDLDDPDLDRCRQGRGPGPARAQGQARRRRHPRADAKRQLVDLTFVPKRDTTVEEITSALKAAADGPAARACSPSPKSRWYRSTSTTPRSARPSTSGRQGARGQAGPRRQLVRQRMGLLEPHVRRRSPHRQTLIGLRDARGMLRASPLGERPSGQYQARGSFMPR